MKKICLFIVLIFCFLLTGCTSSGNTTTEEIPVDKAAKIYSYVFDGRTFSELPDSNKPEDNIYTSRVSFSTKIVTIDSLGAPSFSYNNGNKGYYYLIGCSSTCDWVYDSNDTSKTYVQFTSDIYECSNILNLTFKFTNVQYKSYNGIAKYGVTIDCFLKSGGTIINPSPVKKTLFSAI